MAKMTNKLTLSANDMQKELKNIEQEIKEQYMSLGKNICEIVEYRNKKIHALVDNAIKIRQRCQQANIAATKEKEKAKKNE